MYNGRRATRGCVQHARGVCECGITPRMERASIEESTGGLGARERRARAAEQD